MRSRDLRRSFVLLCVVLLAGCSGESGPSGAIGTAEVNLEIVHTNSDSSAEGFNVDRVDYRITCAGTLPGSIPIPPADTTGANYDYDDSVDMSGAFQIIDTATPPVWQAVMDLPPGDCTMTLTVWDGDEITCIGSETLTIIEDTQTKFDILLVCSISSDSPEGRLYLGGGASLRSGAIGATWDFIDGNYCPQLIWVGADPSVLDPVVPAVTNIQTYSFDSDNQCGDNCDPQTCDRSTNPANCTPGPDLGLVSTWFTLSGVGTFGDPNAFDTTYTCDPLFPGPTDLCVLASDGDIECDQIRCLTIVCP